MKLVGFLGRCGWGEGLVGGSSATGEEGHSIKGDLGPQHLPRHLLLPSHEMSVLFYHILWLGHQKFETMGLLNLRLELTKLSKKQTISSYKLNTWVFCYADGMLMQFCSKTKAMAAA